MNQLLCSLHEQTRPIWPQRKECAAAPETPAPIGPMYILHTQCDQPVNHSLSDHPATWSGLTTV